MRRTLAALTAVLVAGAGVLSAPAATADDRAETGRRDAGSAPSQRLDDGLLDFGAVSGRALASTPTDALTTARRVLEGQAAAADPSATIALRDLWLARPSLRGTERRQADAMLSRPTDGAGDPQEFGYDAPSTAVCGARVCLHYVAPGADVTGPVNDAPPSVDWANLSLAVMEQAWTSEVDDLGYRAPLSDGVRGGDARFDVYLKDLGGDLYGFCAPETRGPGRTARGYCVLDNDFALAQFPTNSPEGNLRVTAAHEFFHAIQYAYDAGEDRWMMESTATWIEERLANDVNDSRNYLPVSQLYKPQIPLDVFAPGGLYQYGNWIFWEYLTTKYGNGLVKKAWKMVGTRKGDGKKYSIQALTKLLRKKGGLTKVYGKFSSSNLVPATVYPEGAEYPVPAVRDSVTLGKRRAAHAKPRLYHLSSVSYRVMPKSSVKRRWKLLVQVNGPVRRTSPSVVLLVHKTNGRVEQKTVRLNRAGDGRKKVAFDSRTVSAVSITLANASSRYRCGKRTWLACGGRSVDDKLGFNLRVRTVR